MFDIISHQGKCKLKPQCSTPTHFHRKNGENEKDNIKSVLVILWKSFLNKNREEGYTSLVKYNHQIESNTFIWVDMCKIFVCYKLPQYTYLFSPKKSLIWTSRMFKILELQLYQDLLIVNSHGLTEKTKTQRKEVICPERYHLRSACLVLVLFSFDIS